MDTHTQTETHMHGGYHMNAKAEMGRCINESRNPKVCPQTTKSWESHGTDSSPQLSEATNSAETLILVFQSLGL